MTHREEDVADVPLENCDPATGESDADRTAGSPTVRLPVDTTLEVLSDPERRVILHYLRHVPDGFATVEDLLDQLQAHYRSASNSVTSEPELRVRLHHSHIPKLTSSGVLDYDSRTGAVRYWSNERVERWLDVIRAEERQTRD